MTSKLEKTRHPGGVNALAHVDDELVAAYTVPALLSVATVAKVLECSTRTVRRRIHEGALPAVIEGDRTMVRGDDLKRYVESLAGTSKDAHRRRPQTRTRTYDFLGA
jgi:excisionase family DNA binding protein